MEKITSRDQEYMLNRLENLITSLSYKYNSCGNLVYFDRTEVCKVLKSRLDDIILPGRRGDFT